MVQFWLTDLIECLQDKDDEAEIKRKEKAREELIASARKFQSEHRCFVVIVLCGDTYDEELAHQLIGSGEGKCYKLSDLKASDRFFSYLVHTLTNATKNQPPPPPPKEMTQILKK